MGRISFSGLLNNGRADRPVIGEGIEPAQESRLSSALKIVAGRQLLDKDESGMLVGQGLATSLQLAVGDSVTLVVNAAEGAMNTRDFVIEGVFQTYSKEYDTRTVKIPLRAAQELLDTSGINVLVVSLHRTADTAAVQQRLAALPVIAGLAVRAWPELNDFYANTVSLYERQFSVLRTIILLMVLLSVANSVNMSALERTGEFGTLRALGNRSRQVFGLVVTENALIGFAGAVVGIAAGVGIALAVSAVGIPMPPPPNANAGYTAKILIIPSVVATAFGVGVAATVLASMLPAWRMSRMSIVDALRQNV
jgi:putative ABC transport system permease protein